MRVYDIEIVNKFGKTISIELKGLYDE